MKFVALISFMLNLEDNYIFTSLNVSKMFLTSNMSSTYNAIYEMVTLFLGIYTIINLASHKSQTKDVCVKILVPHPW